LTVRWGRLPAHVHAFQSRGLRAGTGLRCNLRLPVRTVDAAAWLPHAKPGVTGNPNGELYPRMYSAG